MDESGPTGPAAQSGPVGPAEQSGAAAGSVGGVVVTELVWRPFGSKEPVLPGVTLDIPAGQRVLLVGPSGSGKSTLLRALAGVLESVDSGERGGSVTVGGRDPAAEPGLAGLVLQEPGAGLVAATIGRDVAFGLENLGVPAPQIAPRVEDALAEVGLTMPPTSTPSSLSGGEQQRLALAGVLAMGPQLLLLDEPTAMLDRDNALTVRDAVASVVTRRGLTLVVAEHLIAPWLPLVDRIVVLGEGGQVVADGAPGEVIEAQRESLLAQGIWVPGAADPDPVPIVLPGIEPAYLVGPPGVGADLAEGRALAPGAEVAQGAAGATEAGSAEGAARATVSARGLTVTHETRPLNESARVVTAVAGLDLDAHPGELVALVGPSGAGKSTALAALGGLAAPSSGSVRMPGLTPAGADPRLDAWSSSQLAARVAWVPQWASSAIQARTVGDELMLTARALGIDEVQARARADVLADALGLARLRDVDPRNLSGGEQRRLAIAVAAVHGPALVLADEPTVGQDRGTWAAVLGVLQALRRDHASVIVSTHDEHLMALADTVTPLVPPPQAPQPPRRRPLAGRAGPLSLVAASGLVFLLPLLLASWRQGLVVLGVEVVLAGVALAGAPVRWRSLALRAAPALLAVATIAWSTWLLGTSPAGGRDLEVAASAGLRMATMLLPAVILLPYVDPDDLGDHLAQRLHLPARPVVAACAALHRLQSFSRLWEELLRARRIRGIGAGRSWVGRSWIGRIKEAAAVTFGLLVGALGQAATLALAMDSRGFAGVRRRTWAGGAPWVRADTLVLLAALVVLAVAGAARVVLGS